MARQTLLTIHQEIEEKEKLTALGNINVDLSGLTLERLNNLLQQQAHRLDSNTSSTRLGWACGGELCAIQAAFPLPAGRDIPLSAAPMLVVVSGVGFGKSFSGSVGGIHLGDSPDVVLNVCRERGYGARRENHRLSWDNNWEVAWTEADHKVTGLFFVNRPVLDRARTKVKEHGIEN